MTIEVVQIVSYTVEYHCIILCRGVETVGSVNQVGHGHPRSDASTVVLAPCIASIVKSKVANIQNTMYYYSTASAPWGPPLGDQTDIRLDR